MIYLAVPIKHPDPEIVSTRINIASRVAAHLHDAGIPVFSPASHSEGFISHCRTSRPWAYWARIDLPILTTCCTVLAVLALPGWQESVGVQAEIQVARNRGIEIVYIDRCACGRALETGEHRPPSPDLAQLIEYYERLR